MCNILLRSNELDGPSEIRSDPMRHFWTSISLAILTLALFTTGAFAANVTYELATPGVV
jgi:hypothetical protein